MTSVAQMVLHYLEEDGLVAEALERRIVNLRALARWLVENDHIKASEPAVLSALRRHGRAARPSTYDAARACLVGAQVRTRSQMCLVMIARPRKGTRECAALTRLIDQMEGEIRSVQRNDLIKVVIDEPSLPAFRSLVGHDVSLRLVGGLTEIIITYPSDVLETPGILSLVCTTLAAGGISIVDIDSGSSEQAIYVTSDAAVRAHSAVLRLIQGPSRAAEPQPDVHPRSGVNGPSGARWISVSE